MSSSVTFSQRFSFINAIRHLIFHVGKDGHSIQRHITLYIFH
uniref:Uncharacterized protein n=1 Tax=Lepeophtheirus salmonis TaxID=72036 RepID=A0A0K2U751_LEPSM